MYRQCSNSWNGAPASSVLRLGEIIAAIPFDPDNTDYQQFKANINDESAQLEDADGVLMSPEAAKAYVATLP